MTDKRRVQALGVLLAVSIVGAILFFVTRSGDQRPAPSASGYYAGPMRAKGSTRYGDDSGKEVTPPPGDVVKRQNSPVTASNEVK